MIVQYIHAVMAVAVYQRDGTLFFYFLFLFFIFYFLFFIWKRCQFILDAAAMLLQCKLPAFSCVVVCWIGDYTVCDRPCCTSAQLCIEDTVWQLALTESVTGFPCTITSYSMHAACTGIACLFWYVQAETACMSCTLCFASCRPHSRLHFLFSCIAAADSLECALALTGMCLWVHGS
jgi:hypothetical protein